MNRSTKTISFIAIFAAVNFAVFSYGKIDIPLAAGSTVAIHVANAIVVVSAFLLGPIEGGLAGAIGLSIADLLDPRYVISAPKTFLLKFCIGFISGTLANQFQLSKATPKETLKLSALCASAGLGFNVIFDPIMGFIFKRYFLQVPADAATIILTWTGGVTAFNAIICIFVSTLLYTALKKPFSSIYHK